MVHYISMGGKDRPVLFGMVALYDYENRTGRKPMSEFSNLSGSEVSITTIVELTYSGLIAGHRKEKQAIDFDQYDVAEWLTPEIIERVMVVFSESFPPPDDLIDDAKKKKVTGK